MKIPKLNTLQVIDVPIARIRPYPTNPREHPERQIEMLMASVSKFGMNAPLLVNEQFDLIAGHGRLEAVKRLGFEAVPVITLPHLTLEQQRAYRIADNAISLRGAWSFELLAAEFELIAEADLNFDPVEIGFETPEYDGILSQAGTKPVAEQVALPDSSAPATSRPGDLWIFGKGRHRLLCGDAQERADYERLLLGEKANAVFTDVPYNVPVDGHVCGSGRIKHREFAMASGEMTPAEFEKFLSEIFVLQIEASKPGAVHFQCIDWRSVALMIDTGVELYDRLLNLCIWVKNSPGMGSLWRSQHELVCVFRTPGGKHLNNVQLGKHGRNRSNVWHYEGVTGFSATRRADLAAHPTCKPVAMVADAIRDVTNRNDLVLDPFLGSGTTIIAAQQAGRRAAALEIDPLYVDVSISRIVERTGLDVRHEDGRSFQQVQIDRERETQNGL